jgi:hypothetical protein
MIVACITAAGLAVGLLALFACGLFLEDQGVSVSLATVSRTLVDTGVVPAVLPAVLVVVILLSMLVAVDLSRVVRHGRK